MGRPRRTEDPATNQVMVKLTDQELEALDRQRAAGESRAAAVRRLLRLGKEEARADRAALLRGALLRMGTSPAEADRVLAELGDRVLTASLAEVMSAAVKLMR